MRTGREPPSRRGARRSGGRAGAAKPGVVVALVVALAAGCAKSTPIEVSETTTTTLRTDLGVAAGVLEGVRGVEPGSSKATNFEKRLRAADPALRDLAGAAEAYDAVLLVAIAAEQSRSDAPGPIAAAMPSVSLRGEICATFESCRALAETNTDLDYDGPSGGIQLLENGDPGEARFTRVRFGRDGLLEADQEIVTQAEALAAPPPPADPTFGPPADGVLRLGMLLPVNGPDPQRARAAQLGVTLAVDDVNEAGGVLGTPIMLIPDQTGDGSRDAVAAAVTRLVEQRVDAVIGGTTFAIDGVAVGPLVEAGIVMVSPTDRNRGLSAVPDRGLFLRTIAPEDVEGRVLASLPVDDGYSDVAVIAPSAGSEFELAADVTAELNARKAKVVAAPVLDAGGDAAAAVAQVVAAAATAVILVLPIGETATVIRQLADRGLAPTDFPVYAISNAMNLELVRTISEG